MPWPFRRKPSRPASPPPSGGTRQSPGLGLVVAELERRVRSSILDLGPPSTETLATLGRRGDVEVVDLFRSCALDGAGGLSFRIADGMPLPAAGAYDAVLVWDLLHYVAPDERPRFGERLRDLCLPGAVVLVIASTAAPVPPAPVHYRVVGRDRLAWQEPAGPRLPAPRLVARAVEKAMPGFTTWRVIQLKSGLQEMVLRRDAPDAAADDGSLAPPAAEG